MNDFVYEWMNECNCSRLFCLQMIPLWYCGEKYNTVVGCCWKRIEEKNNGLTHVAILIYSHYCANILLKRASLYKNTLLFAPLYSWYVILWLHLMFFFRSWLKFCWNKSKRIVVRNAMDDLNHDVASESKGLRLHYGCRPSQSGRRKQVVTQRFTPDHQSCSLLLAKTFAAHDIFFHLAAPVGRRLECH